MKLFLQTLFIFLLQGCFSSDHDVVISTPEIETSVSLGNWFSEVIVRGEANSLVYVNGKKIGIIGSNGETMIRLQIPQDEKNAMFTLILKDEIGNESDAVLFSLTYEPADESSDSNSSIEDNDNHNDENNSVENENLDFDNNSNTILGTLTSIIHTNQSVIIGTGGSNPNTSTTGNVESNSSVEDGNQSSSIDTNTTIEIPDDNKTETNTSSTIPIPINSLITVTLSHTSIELAEGSSRVLHVNATYKDNKTTEVTKNVQWIIADTSQITMLANGELKALKVGETTLQARYKNITSQGLHVTVFRAVNGHRLPPEPNEDINNATLLGIDSNNNGVRDDVEIWIFETYTHPIVQAVAMQNARAFQIILVEPDKARETLKIMENASDCGYFYKYHAEDYNETIVIPRRKSLYKESRPLILNTRERSRAYYEYNQALSGGVYSQRPDDTLKSKCDFNSTKVLRGEW